MDIKHKLVGTFKHKVTADEWNDPHETSAISRVRAFRSGSAQSIPDSTYTKVQFNAESWDDDGEYDPTTNFRFTAKKACKISVKATILLLSAVADRNVDLMIYRNGSPHSVADFHVGHADNISAHVADDVSLDVNDYVEIWIWHNCGAAKSIHTDPTYSSMSIHELV